ncbi:craniofacial development protein 1 [Ornithorhynchus anatinus]|uniref:Craniofacial development protein 1 n=1 Tax=Ornithorhynchus anatinus TaxID=9258 RepID=A0A6I8PQE7_ORNAN|nr:craniofacial development protein 1 [Ornithorhynchus anatinus]
MDGADSDEFSSSEEDEDYVPSGGEYSEDDGSELVREDEVDGGEESVPKSQKRKSQSVLARKRKKAGLSVETEEADGKAEESSGAEDEAAAEQGKRSKSEDERKKKEDALWASFLSDVGPKARDPPGAHVQTATDSQAKSSSKPPVTQKEPEKPKGAEKVTITKVFDFAGEEVRVTKEVDAASKEAKSFFKLSEKEKPQADTPSAASTLPTGSGVKKPSGMNSLLGKIGAKKQKMSTLEKSKLDWETFKEEEGIGEELAIHNRGKEGYIERKAFLERVDHRQFEIERDLRLSKMKP